MSVNKEELFYKCLELVDKQIKKYQEILDSISGYNEENNLHPDFDEYGNKGEMLTTYEQNVEYLDNAQKMKETLANLDREHRSEIIRPGSLVETLKSYYFISVPLGEINMGNGTHVYAISTESPIYENLENKKAGDKFIFHDEEIEILRVF